MPQANPSAQAPKPLVTKPIPIDDHCVGERWSTHEEDQLSRLIAIIAIGQASQAAHVLKNLLPASPAFTTEHLRQEAKIKLSVQEKKQEPRTGYPRWQRDGFIFEAISWIAVRQCHSAQVLLTDPHLSSTSQGLDRLMIELSSDKSKVEMTTVFEDKCTDNPRQTFLQQVIPALVDRHQNKRSAELVASASVLLRMAGIDDAAAARLSEAVTNRNQRRYHSAFALPTEYDDQQEREKLFAGYSAVDGIAKDRRVGATFIISGNLRDWFDTLASLAVAHLDNLEPSEV